MAGRDCAARLFGFFAAQREQDELGRGLGDEAPGHGLTHEAVTAEDQDCLAADVHAPAV